MKKFLFLLTLCLLSFSMQGKVVIFESHPGYYPAVLPLTFNVDGVTLSVYGTVSPPGYNFYSNGPSSISTSNGVITRIEFENASGSSFTFSTGSVVDYGTTAVWSGYASEIVFYVNVLTGRIIVTLDEPEVVSCGIGEYADHYDEMIVSAYDAVVLAQYGNYLYFKDETGFGLVFGNVGQTYHIGDVIPAGFGGKVKSYDCQPELSQPTGFQPAKGKVEVEAEEITLTQIDEAHWAHYVVIRGVTYDPNVIVLRDSYGNEIPVYNRFNINLPTTERGPIDVYGIVGAYRPCPNTIYQFLPTEIPLVIDDPNLVVMECTYQNGSYLYGRIREIFASSGLAPGDQVLVFGNVGDTFTNGDIIRGHYRVDVYYEMPEIIPIDDWEKIGETDRIYPELMTIEDVSLDMIHNYLSFNGVTLNHFNEPDMTIEDETGSLLMFNKFNVWPPLYWEEINVDTILALIKRILTGEVNYNPSQTFYVEGFLSCYGRDHTLELLPTYIEQTSWVLNDDINGDGEVNLADVNELINYILWDDY
jgi:hypothetical protein